MQLPETHPFWDGLFPALRAQRSRAAYALVCKRWLCEMRVYPPFPIAFPPPPCQPTPLESLALGQASAHRPLIALALWVMSEYSFKAISYMETWTRQTQNGRLVHCADGLRPTQDVIIKSSMPGYGCYTWPQGTLIPPAAFLYSDEELLARFSQGFAQETIEFETMHLAANDARYEWINQIAQACSGNPWLAIAHKSAHQ